MHPSPVSRRNDRLHRGLRSAFVDSRLPFNFPLRSAHAENRVVPASRLARWRLLAGVCVAFGAVHTAAAAASLIPSQPNPVSVSVGRAITPITFSVSETPNLGSWVLGGSLPPGLRLTATQGGAELNGPGTLDATTPSMDDGYGYIIPGNTTTTPVLTGTPTTAGTYTLSLQVYQQGGLSGATAGPFNYTITVAADAGTNAPPTFTTQPAPQTAAAGGTITLSAAANGTPAPTYQWQKGGSPIPGATNATLTLSNVQASDAGTYTLVATNSAGESRSTPVTVAVTTPGGAAAPSIARQPQAQTMTLGSTVVFNTDATGAPLSYQWLRNGNPVSGATNATLVLESVSTADAGTYSVVISNAGGSITSSNVPLVLTSDPNFGHLVNLSIRTSITAADPFFTVGTVVGGAGTSGLKPMLVRAVGPSLGAFGLTGAITDARVDVYAGSAVIAANDDWNGDAGLTAAFTRVGAFALASTASKDAAIFDPAFVARDYTVQVGGVGGATGEVLAELYDATASDAFTATTPRLVNVSVRKQIDAGGSLTVGFVVGGNTARTVLVRAIGPGLAAFGVPGTMPDPRLALFNGAQVRTVENDNWGGDPQLTRAGTAVGAFGIADAGSKDAMILTTLAPGNYTVEVNGVPNTGGGSVLIEVYEVP